MSAPGDVTKLLHEVRQGNRQAETELMSLVHAELRNIARRFMRRERSNHTLQPTELVNEAYLRLVQQEDREYQSRSHFYAAAAQAMRRFLVDHARTRSAAKRGGGAGKINIDEIQVAFEIRSEELVDLDEALSRLSQMDPRQGSVVELRVFGGLTEEEIAELLHVSARTVKRDWRSARAWLYGEITGTRTPTAKPR